MTADAKTADAVYADRVARARVEMAAAGVDVVLLSVGPDLPYLTGYEAMPLERLTMLVLPREGDATLVVPRLEAPRVVEQPDVFTLLPWDETDDPVALVADLAKGADVAAIGDHTWARFLVDLLGQLPDHDLPAGQRRHRPSACRKDAAEIAALRAAGAAADRVAAQLQAGEIPLVGTRPRPTCRPDISRRLLAEGHDQVNFAIVAAGENAASPHHHASTRVIRHGEVVLCDFGGTSTATAATSPAASRSASRRPRSPRRTPCCSRPSRPPWPPPSSARRARRSTPSPDASSADAGYGERFIHRTGHGIGMEEHEDPYIVEGNALPLAPGHAFSVEPGIYRPAGGACAWRTSWSPPTPAPTP